MNKKMRKKCPNCGHRDFWRFQENKYYFCGICGYSMNPDGTEYIAPPRQYYICPKCGKGWDYADDERHICMNKKCQYEPIIKTEFSDKDYENARTSSPEIFDQFKSNLREKYTIHSPQFDKELYEEILQDEYKYFLKMESLKVREAQERQSNANKIHCPKCGSINITTGQRGYSLLTGFLGSNKTVNRCGSCGYKWTP